MDLRQYLRAIRRSWWIVVFVVILLGAAGYAKAAREPKVYSASATFIVNTPQTDGTSALGNDQAAQNQANSYADLLGSSQQFARLVLQNTSLRLTAGELSAKISGSARINTVLIDATMRDTSVRRLRVIQSGVVSQFPAFVRQIQLGTTVTATSSPPVSAVPVAPRTSIDVIVGLAAGLILGLLIAGLRELIDTSLRSGTELEAVVGVPLIGSIAYDSSAKGEPVVTAELAAHSRRAEDFRQLRTNLEFIHTADKVQVVVVTSSVAGEGKSSTAVNIAATAAERGGRVLLIDADLRRPQVADYLGFDRFVGLTTVLAGQVAESVAVRTWGEHGLAVLPSGATPPNPSELLNSAPMRALVQRWRATYDLVVIDTPPALVVTDAAVCSALADGVLMVYRYGRTRRANLLGALHALRAVDARIVGVVLNMRPRKGADGESYGGYDSYVNASSSRVRRILARLTPWRHRRRPRSELGPASPALRLTPEAPPLAIDEPVGPPAADGSFHPPVEAPPAPTVTSAYDDWARFEARRQRRPLRSGRLRVEHLPDLRLPADPDQVEDLATDGADASPLRGSAPAGAHRVDEPAVDRRDDVGPDDEYDGGLLDQFDSDEPELDDATGPAEPGTGGARNGRQNGARAVTLVRTGRKSSDRRAG